ncbi:hypothetical protein IBA8401_30750 [Pseudomonas syringae]
MSHNNNSNIRRFTFLTLGLMSLAATVQATENGALTTSFGVYDFGAGILPPSTPVGTLGMRVAFYSTNVQKDRHGRRWTTIFPWTFCPSALRTFA